jgi:hypothetical protein
MQSITRKGISLCLINSNEKGNPSLMYIHFCESPSVLSFERDLNILKTFMIFYKIFTVILNSLPEVIFSNHKCSIVHCNPLNGT